MKKFLCRCMHLDASHILECVKVISFQSYKPSANAKCSTILCTKFSAPQGLCILKRMNLCVSPFCSLDPNTNLYSQNSKFSGNFMATTIRSVTIRSQKQEQFKELKKKSTKDFAPFCTSRFCSCVTRRHLIQGFGSLLLPIGPSIASDLPPNDPLV